MTFAIAALAIYACGNRGQKQTADQTSAETQQIVDIHNAANSLDYQGTYKGIIPTEQGDVDLTLSITDKEYTRVAFPAGQPQSARTTTGTFEWSGGSEIMLDGLELPDRFFVAENRLIVLDEQGNRIEGENAAKYVMAKQ